jgi:hypothetical protein
MCCTDDSTRLFHVHFTLDMTITGIAPLTDEVPACKQLCLHSAHMETLEFFSSVSALKFTFLSTRPGSADINFSLHRHDKNSTTESTAPTALPM